MRLQWLFLGLAASCAFADPVAVGTKSEVLRAKGLIDSLVASGATAEKLLSMATETDKGPERFWLYSNAFALQAKEEKFAEATETLKSLQQEVTDIPEVNIINLIERNVGKKLSEAPELAQILKDSRVKLVAQRLILKYQQNMRKYPKDAAVKASLGEAFAANGNWDKALKMFVGAAGKIAAVAEAELRGKRTMKIAEFWWDYKPCRELSSSTAFKTHAVNPKFHAAV